MTMFPGVNPRQMKQMMKQMGIQQQEIDATEVIIRCPDREIVIKNPQVSKVNMLGQKTWQVVGEEEERSLDTKPEIGEDDVKTVMEQTGSSEEKARAAIEEASGDLAQAILTLKS